MDRNFNIRPLEWNNILLIFFLVLFGSGVSWSQSDTIHKWEMQSPNYDAFEKKQSVAERLALIEPLLHNSPESALMLLSNLISENKHSVDLKKNQSKVNAFIAVCYLRKGDYAKSKLYLDIAFKAAAADMDKEMLVYLHNINALIFQQSGNYSKSIDHYISAIEIIKSGLSDKRSRQTYINFGGFWSTLGEHKQALKYYNLAESLLNKSNEKDPYVIMNIGIAKADSSSNFAIDKFKEALIAINSGGDLHITHKLYINLCNAYRIEKQFDSAHFYLNKANAATQLLNTDVAKALYYSESGHLLFEEGKLQKAEVDLMKALQFAQLSGQRMLIKEANETLSQLYKQKGDYKLAFNHQQAAIQFQDSLDKIEKHKTVDLMLDYQRAEQRRMLSSSELELTKKRSEIRQRNIWITFIVTGATGLILLIFFAYWNSKNKQKLQTNELALLRQKQEMEKMKAIADGEEKERSRIAHELHDSVMVEFAAVKMQLNALPNTFPALVQSPEHNQLIQQIDRAAKELRMTAHNLMPDLLLDEGIVQATYYFCNNIQKLSGIQISFQYIGKELPRFNMDFELLIYRVIQELIQNIIKHSSASKVLLQIAYDLEFLSITIEDNGKGFDNDNFKEGVGLRSIKNRLMMFNSSIDIKSIVDAGTTVLVECPTKNLILGK